MAKRKGDLPPKLRAVLLRLGRAVSLNVTQAVKLPYLVDVAAQHLLGGSITGGTHETWENGVVTSQVWHYLTKHNDPAVFHLEPVLYSEERKVVIEAEESEESLSPEERQVVDAVAKAYGTLRAADLGRMTKFMNPGVTLWGANFKASTGDDAYERMSASYQEMATAIASLTLEDLKRDSVVLEDLEAALA